MSVLVSYILKSLLEHIYLAHHMCYYTIPSIIHYRSPQAVGWQNKRVSAEQEIVLEQTYC